MAETNSNKPVFESQKERWLKYGANVAVAIIVVIALAGVIVFLAQKTGRRIDTTEARLYSLKPQTVNILNDLKGKTKLVGLYRKEIPTGKGGMKPSPYVGPVVDLLDEYRRKSNKIDVEIVDPVQNNPKVESLISEVAGKYGGEVAKYKAVTDTYKAKFDQIKEIALAETAKVSKLPVDQIPKDEDAQVPTTALLQIRTVPKELATLTENIDAALAETPPDYKGATDDISREMTEFSRIATRIIEIFDKTKDDKKWPDPIRQYMAGAKPVYENIKKIADDLVAQTKDLGELKLDDLRTSLKQRDVILVVGEADMRVIPFEQVWKVDDQELKQMAPGQELKPRFAGEQQISTAILALNQTKKPKVCFVRNGGSPLAEPGQFPFRRGGPMSAVADRLRQYNFEVLEKDLSGMWAMQAQMQQMPTAPEPSDEQIKDAIWIVLAFPMGQQDPRMPTPTIGPKVQEHLKNGGSAMIIFAPRADNMNDVLKEWGIEVHNEAVAVHQLIAQTDARQGDAVDEAQRYPFVFDINDYGDHPITRPLQSLDSWLVPLLVVKTTAPAAGVKTTPIIPVPTEPKSWGETDLESLQETETTFDEKTDLAGPIYGGAAAEKEKGGRLVVIASPMFAFDRWVNEPDITVLRKTGYAASRFPANGELFANSVFWMARMEPLIAISPSAMEVARIAPIAKGTLKTWKVILFFGLPAAVVVWGVLTWVKRRD